VSCVLTVFGCILQIILAISEPFWRMGYGTGYWVVKGEAPRRQKVEQAARRSSSSDRRQRTSRNGVRISPVAAAQEYTRAKVKRMAAEANTLDPATEGCSNKDTQLRSSSTAQVDKHEVKSGALSQCKAGKVCNVATCPSGHVLVSFTTSLPAICGVCTSEPAVGSTVWGCRECDFDCCFDCHGEDSDASTCAPTQDRHLHDGTSTASTDTPRGDHDVTWTHSDDVWWPQEATWSWDWSELQQSTDYESEFDLTDVMPADETLIGPDGELYEVFYPCGDAMATCSEEMFLDMIDLQLHGEDFEAACSNSAQTSAEIGISSILSYMRGVAVMKYPAKARLFETVQTATAIALGDHFQRFTLVGSTALRIDTPDSDIDVVVFTQSTTSVTGEEHVPPGATQILSQVAKTLRACDPSLRLQLVDCTRVPVLTVYTGDAELSLDLTVDQPLSECHVLWLQSQRRDPIPDDSFMREVPVPTLDGWEQGLEAAALRCVKWWLRRRQIPVSKEGGYPTVVWTLMVIHVLRCSVFYNEADSNQGKPVADERTLLGAIATFFDRFAEGGLAGTLLFAEGKQAEFWPQTLPKDNVQALPVLSGESFSVLDPTTTGQECAAFGIMPVELAPRISFATQLLHAYELSRGQELSQQALMCEEDSLSSIDGGVALSALFAEASEQVYLLPAYVPPEPAGVIFLCEGILVFGILQRINLKHGWGATFLNRRDTQSSLAVIICDVDVEMHSVTPRFDLSQQWLQPCDVVCMASISCRDECCHWDCPENLVFNIDVESLERWCKMHALLHRGADSTCTVATSRKANRHKKAERHRRQGKNARI